HGRGKSEDAYYRSLINQENKHEEAKDEGSDRS
ncbi:GTP pyrophosphokinase family protein, partial [Enterococcus faecium]|nr:GTP pyrophosphokinase family protein [Enterococcus faecium]